MGTPYCGFLEELREFYDGDISTEKVSKSIGVLINATRYNWAGTVVRKDANGMDERCCTFCKKPKRDTAAMHLVFECRHFERDGAMQWNQRTNFKEKIVFLEHLQLRTEQL